ARWFDPSPRLLVVRRRVALVELRPAVVGQHLVVGAVLFTVLMEEIRKAVVQAAFLVQTEFGAALTDEPGVSDGLGIACEHARHLFRRAQCELAVGPPQLMGSLQRAALL